MADAVKLDSMAFQRRFLGLCRYWKDNAEAFQNADALVVPAGQPSPDGSLTYQKSASLQTWLFGYEFPDTLLLIPRADSAPQIQVLCSAKKATILEQLNVASQRPFIRAHRRSKDAAENQQLMDGFLDCLKGCKKLGTFPKDEAHGPLIEEWSRKFAAVREAGGMELVDMSVGMGTVLAVKDTDELKLIAVACRISSTVMQKYFAEEMAVILDEEKSVTHAKLAERVEQTLFDDKIRRKLQFPNSVNVDLLDWCYTPIIQSGGVYDLKASAQSSDDSLKPGVITCSLGVRYRNYCSNVGRTYLIDPDEDMKKNYTFLLDVQKVCVKTMKEGTTCASVYAAAVKHIVDHRPDLETHFVKNIGFAMGVEFRDSTLLLSGKNTRELIKDMTFNLSLGFQNLKSKSNGSYALQLIDSVLVGETEATFITDSTKALEDIFFEWKGDSDVEEVKKEPVALPPRNAKTAVLRTKLRGDNRDESDSVEAKRRQHQDQLLQLRCQEGLARYRGTGDAEASENRPAFRRFESYKKDNLLPREIRNGKLLVDKRAESIILPVFGFAVPFHVSTLKNVSKSEEGEFVYLRLNFNTPGQTIKKDEVLPFDDPNAHFIRSFTFRSSDLGRYNDLYKEISELKRDITKKEAQRREMADLVQQDRLMDSKRPISILPEVTIRPALEGKKLPGDLQIHQNGLRYAPIRGDQRVDILFSNVKHLFFQPCDHELYVILHFHLKNPIMVGKRKTKDVQFVREASDASFDETSNRRRRAHYGDEDELMAEQEERRRRQKLNKEFKTFAEKIYEVSGETLEADVPIRELGFNGVPSRSSVLMQPTTECLVHLTEPPFLVVTLSEVELAYLERVQFHIKNFDIVFVFKDLKRPPVHINSIPMSQVEPIREWLDSMDLVFMEGPTALNWTVLLKAINEDAAGFYEQGGWGNMKEGGTSTDGEDEEDFESSESEYQASSEDEEDESESDFSEEEEESSSASEADEDESGEDWDEKDEKARRSSLKKRREDEVDTQPRKKKR